VVVVLHGNFDRPEWSCDAWGPLVAGRAFVLCPRGIPRGDAPGLDRWHYGGRPSILREVAAGRASFDFSHPIAGGFTTDPSQPEEAIAFRAEDLREMLAEAGLELQEPIRFGLWSNHEDGPAGQDIVIARR